MPPSNPIGPPPPINPESIPIGRPLRGARLSKRRGNRKAPRRSLTLGHPGWLRGSGQALDVQVNIISREVDKPFPKRQADKVHQVVDLNICSVM